LFFIVDLLKKFVLLFVPFLKHNNMKINQVTTTIILEKRKINAQKLAPVKLRIFYMGKYYYLTIRNTNGDAIWLTEIEFEKIMSKKPIGEYKDMSLYLNKVEVDAKEKADKVIGTYQRFIFEKFKALFIEKISLTDNMDLLTAIKQSADELRKNGRISTAISYECAYNSIKKFANKNMLLFQECTPDFWGEYEKWFLNNGNSITTVGIYLRNVRTIFNMKINDGIIPSSCYPFKKYKIPTGKNIKKALSKDDVKTIVEFRFNSNRDFYKDLWVFSYLNNGMNIKDIANLKYSNIDDDFIVFERAKTKHSTRTKPQTIEVPIHMEAEKILDKYGTKTGAYIFNILKANMTPEQEYRAIQQMVRNINEAMLVVSDLLGLPKVTTYTARHSFATVLKRSGGSYELIMEQLGHASIKSTKSYFGSFDRDTKRDMSSKLL